MIKQIRLRGISRSPSDRMTQDGGLAECLNLQLDQGELVPMPKPQDISDEVFGDLASSSRMITAMYIHQGTYYSNYIVWRVIGPIYEHGSYRVVYSLISSSGGTTTTIRSWSVDGQDYSLKPQITSVGNTLVVLFNDDMYYFLFKDGEYRYLGDHIPVPQLRFYMNPDSINREPSVSGDTPVPSDIDTDTVDFMKSPTSRYNDKGVDLTVSDWGVDGNAYKVKTEKQRAVLDAINTVVSTRSMDANEEGKCIFPVFLRYALRMYDGTLYGCSAPILMGGELNNYISLRMISLLSDRTVPHQEGGTTTNTPIYEVGASVKTPAKYSIVADFTYNNITKADWEDLIVGIELYVSTPILPYVDYDAIQLSDREAATPSSGGVYDWFAAKATLDPVRWQNKQEEILLAHQTTYFAKKWSLDELEDLTQVALTDINYSGEWLATQGVMVESYNSVHRLAGDKISSYNNRLMLEGAKMELYPGYPFFPGTYPISSSGNSDTFSFVWHLMIDGEEKTVITKDPGGDRHMSPLMAGSYEQSFIWWFSYPDARAVSLDVYEETSEYVFIRRFPAKAFTEANVSYVFAGFGTTPSLPPLNIFSGDFPDDDPIAVLPDQILMSKSDNPFIFPADGVIDFNGANVFGTGMATKALSEGQFGQFPIYVFTSTGIWSLTLNSEGGFVAKHPVSRDVALEGTIVPIDQAIVFTTKKGVMVLSGSDIASISPDMNGKHYVLDGEAAALLETGGLSGLVAASQNPESFQDFMQAAKPVYDYTGERIVFGSETYGGYMYVYRLNTGTWHKMTLIQADGEDSGAYYVVSALNSYPNAVMSLLDGEGNAKVINLSTVLDTDGDVDNAMEDGLSTSLDTDGDGDNAMENGLSTVLDADGTGGNAMENGLVVTRAMDFDERDIRKTLRDLRIRGAYHRGHAKYILLGSFDGFTWHRLHSLRGASFKLFRLIIVTTLAAAERISWVEVDYQTRFTNRLR